MQPLAPEAVVFDLDGLLIDSEDAWGRAEQAVVTALGQPWDPAIRTLLLGHGPEEASRLLAEHLGAGHDAGEIDRLLLAAAIAEFDGGLPARPGAVALIEALDVPLAVATNSRRELAETALYAAGLSEVFATIVTCEDVAHPKPAPDPYLLACERLGSQPPRTLVLEDSPVGVQAAKAAGCHVIGVPSYAHSDLSAADHVAADLHEVRSLLA